MRSRPLVLGFDTSAAHCAAALLCGEALVGSVSEAMEKGQAERLMPLLAELLAGQGAGWRDLAAIGVGTGPGNFTGVRISVAAARGLALSLGIAAIGVNRFEAAALGLPRPLLVVEDARHGTCYAQGFGPDAAARLTTYAALAEETAPGALLAGTGAVHLAALLAGARVAGAAMPLAEAITRLAAARMASPQPRPAPLYLRGADAAPPADPAPLIVP